MFLLMELACVSQRITSVFKGYVQQILVKATIAPWDRRGLRPSDAFRTPLHKMFSLLNELNYYQVDNEAGGVIRWSAAVCAG